MSRDAWLMMYAVSLIFWGLGLLFTADAMCLIMVERPYGRMARWGLGFLIIGAILYGIVEWHR